MVERRQTPIAPEMPWTPGDRGVTPFLEPPGGSPVAGRVSRWPPGAISHPVGRGPVDARQPTYATMWPVVTTTRPATAVVRARIDPRVKAEATAVLGAIGLTVSDAVRLMMTRIAAEKRLPFAPLVPNAETVAALESARRGDLVGHGGLDQLMADLEATPNDPS